MPRLVASAQASSRLSFEENRDGIAMPVTCFAPSASTARAAVTAESMPPERPITTSVNPHLTDVVAQPEDQAAPDLLGLIDIHHRVARLARQVDQRAMLFEPRRAEDGASLRVDHDRRTVEQQLVVSANLIHIDKRRLVALCNIGEEVEADLPLSGVERRGGDIEENPRILSRQLIDGVVAVNVDAEDFVVEPEVLADADACR